MKRDEIFQILSDKEYEDYPNDIMAREYLAVLFGSDKFLVTDNDIAELSEEISEEQLILNAFDDFRKWYSR